MPDRVAVDVDGRRLELLFPLDHLAVEAVAEEMAPAVVPLVESLCVDAVELLHAGGELLEPALHDRVEVVSHEDEDDRVPAVAPFYALAKAHPGAAIVVVARDRDAADPARRHVVEAVRRQHVPRQAGHRSTVTRRRPSALRVTKSSRVRHTSAPNGSRGLSPGHGRAGHCPGDSPPDRAAADISVPDVSGRDVSGGLSPGQRHGGSRGAAATISTPARAPGSRRSRARRRFPACRGWRPLRFHGSRRSSTRVVADAAGGPALSRRGAQPCR